MKKFITFILILTSTLLYGDPRGELLKLPKDVTIFLDQLGSIKVGNQLNYAPYDFNMNDKPMGLSVDTMKIIGSILGLEIEWVYGYSSMELLTLMEERKIDVLPCIAPSRKTIEFIDFSSPLFITNIGALVAEDNKTRNLDLNSKRVGYVNGYEVVETILKQYKGSEVKLVESIPNGIKLLNQGDIDSLIDSIHALEYYKKERLISRLGINEFNSELQLSIGVRSDWERLSFAINAALNWIYSEEIGIIIDRYIEDEKSKGSFQLVPVTFSMDETEILLFSREIKIYILDNLSPVSYLEDGSPQGIIKGYLDEISKSLGVNFTIINKDNYSLSDGLDSLDRGESDLILGISTSEERIKQGIWFGTPFMELSVAVYKNKKGTYLNNIKSLEGKVVYAIEGHTIIEWIEGQYPGINIIPVSSVKTGLERVDEEDGSYYLGDSLITNRAIAEGHYNNTVFANYSPYTYKLSAASNNLKLLNLIDKELGKIDINRRNSIESFWIGQEVISSIDPHLKVIIILIIVIVLLILISLLVYLKVKKKIIEDHSNHDRLTGLYNRRVVERIYNRELSRALREDKFLVFMIFKLKSYSTGDCVLIEVAEVLKSSLRRGSDYLFRLENDEFGVITTLKNRDHTIILGDKVVNSSDSKLYFGFWCNNSIRDLTFDRVYSLAKKNLQV